MMEQTWGFTRPPFTKDLAVADYFLSQQFRELTARLQIMVETRALGLITGDIGSGKSCGIRYLASQLDPSHTPVVYVAESHLTPFDFYAQILEAFGVTAPFQRAQARRQFVTLMTDLYQHQNKQPVIIIDEAQSLPPAMIQEFRFVLNTAMDALTPFTCILVGQPDLRALLRLRAFEAIQQRVGIRFHLTGLNAAETEAYVAHHCQQAGVTRPLFTPSALHMLFVHSQGLPRVINRLATGALWDAATQGTSLVDEPHMQRSVTDWRDA